MTFYIQNLLTIQDRLLRQSKREVIHAKGKAEPTNEKK